MEDKVQAFALLVFSHAQPYHRIDQLQQDEGDDGAIQRGNPSAQGLGGQAAIGAANFFTASTPVSKAPKMPPMPCTPKASSESS